MTNTRRLCSIALVFLALLVALPAHAREWQRAELPGMVLYSDGYPHELQRWALKVRLIDALLRERFGIAANDADPGSTLTVYLLDEDDDVGRLTGRENLSGLYSPSVEGSFLIASREPGYDKFRFSGQMSLFHEYTHHFMYRHFASSWPAWYREGFAEYVGAVTFDLDWKARIAGPNWPRLKHLVGKPMPLATILTASVEDYKPDEKARFYAWSWKLVHLLNGTPEDRQRLDRYLSLYASGGEPLEAARDAFGDLAALEARLHAHVPDPRGGEIMHVALTGSSELAVTALDPVESRLVELRLARLAGGNRKAALASLRAFAAANPGNAQGRRELASALKDVDRAAAREQVLVALSLAPQDARALAIWSDIALQQIKGDPASMPSDWDRVRRRLSTAIIPDTRDPMLLALLFRSYLMEPRRPSPQSLTAMEKAVLLQPESYELRFLGIYALAMSGRMIEARRAAQVLASDPHAGIMGKQAMAAVDAIGQ